MYCTQCGAELKDGVKFCTQCGSVVKEKKDTVHYEGSNSNNNVQEANNVTTVENVNSNEIIANDEATVVPGSSDSIEKPKKKNGLLIAVVIFLVLLIIGISGAAFWMSGGKDMIMDIFGVAESSYDAERIENSHNESAKEDKEEQKESENSTLDNVKGENDKVEYVDTATSIDNSIESTEDEMEEFANDESESEYIFENSDTGYLSRSELDGLSAEECRIARNELYARHGRLFDDEELQEYFNSCSWYVGTISAKDFSEDILNEYEIANRDLIVKYEKEMGYR